MKKYIILSVAIVTTLITSVVVIQYLNSFKDISFVIKQSGIELDIYKKSDSKTIIKKLTSDSKISLQKGDYYYIVKAPMFDSTQYQFSVADLNNDITVDPNYSAAYLASVLLDEKPAIDNLIKTTYPTDINNYSFITEQLFQKGEWYGAVLRNNIYTQGGMSDPYRIILHKVNNTWTIVHYPEIVVTTSNNPNVPVDILNQVNNLVYS